MSFEVDTGAAKDGHLSDSDSTNDTGDSNHSNEKENEEPRHLPAVLFGFEFFSLLSLLIFIYFFLFFYVYTQMSARYNLSSDIKRNLVFHVNDLHCTYDDIIFQ